MDPLNLSNGGVFLRTGILKESIKLQKEKRKFVVVCSSPPSKSSIKRLIRGIHVLNKLFLEIVVVVVVVIA